MNESEIMSEAKSLDFSKIRDYMKKVSDSLGFDIELVYSFLSPSPIERLCSGLYLHPAADRQRQGDQRPGHGARGRVSKCLQWGKWEFYKADSIC